MKRLVKTFACLLTLFTVGTVSTFAANQTPDTSVILPGTGLPFRVVIEQANFRLPVGFHSGVVGSYKSYWIFIAGRINGMHGFGPDPFPPDQQNKSIYVINTTTGAVYSRALNDPSSGLDQRQIDTLSVTSPEGYQSDSTLYMVGGYGVDTATSTFGTKPVLTAFNLPGVVAWVMQPGNKSLTLSASMTQLYNPIFQVTGGSLQKLGNVMQLVFGQNFTGVYTPGSNGDYIQQVRQFIIGSNGGHLTVDILNAMPMSPDPNFRRRDLNILPTLLTNHSAFLQNGLIAYAGVFTETGGVWTVPVIINGKDNPIMPDPTLPTTFKQGMNQYVCATASLYSNKSTNMYHIFFGGISYGYFSGGTFQVDPNDPFINQVTTIKMDKDRNFTQYLMDNEYPTILATGGLHPGSALLFGAGAFFIPSNILKYSNGIINLDNIRQATVIGYIVGGIQSTVPNTSQPELESAASPYVFKVTLVPT